jgi:hypothetical protein
LDGAPGNLSAQDDNLRVFLAYFSVLLFQFRFSRCALSGKILSPMILAFVLTAALPPQASAFPQLDPLAARKAGIEDGPRARIERDMAKKANQQRQADLRRDTEKLLKLATELKDSVDKSSEGTLSLDVIKKAEEIEKLARSVKDKMKAAY